jgi:hypothetical protein
VVPAASGFGSTEVHPATIPGRSMGERRWQHILALYYRRNGPHPALIDRHMHDEPQTVYVGLIGLGLLSMTSGATFSHAPRHHSNRLLTKLREIRHPRYPSNGVPHPLGDQGPEAAGSADGAEKIRQPALKRMI